MDTRYVKRNDTGDWEYELRDVNGVVDLTAATAVKVWLADAAGTLVINGAAAEVVDAVGGRIRYVPQAAEVQAGGTYRLEFEVEWSDGTQDTFPSQGYNVVEIAADLGES